jgi:hypothetical protein
MRKRDNLYTLTDYTIDYSITLIRSFPQVRQTVFLDDASQERLRRNSSNEPYETLDKVKGVAW